MTDNEIAEMIYGELSEGIERCTKSIDECWDCNSRYACVKGKRLIDWQRYYKEWLVNKNDC